jgi:hypothetical protein
MTLIMRAPGHRAWWASKDTAVTRVPLAATNSGAGPLFPIV